jgi:hypothetical protein
LGIIGVTTALIMISAQGAVRQMKHLITFSGVQMKNSVPVAKKVYYKFKQWRGG